MLRYLSADYILPVSSAPIKNGLVVVDEAGTIIDLIDAEHATAFTDQTEFFDGIIIPGFVNAHCHLELSHMKDWVAQGAGLLNFIRAVITMRFADEGQIMNAMERFDQSMFNNGIVAVGDISNTGLSKQVKSSSKIYYHTFLELLGFDPFRAVSVFEKALDLKNEFAPLPCSIVPHAPYSVSEDLFQILKQYADNHYNLITIHNQETEQENMFFRNKEGDFIDFYRFLNQDISYFRPQNRSSLQAILPLLSEKQKIMFVHNTYTDESDISFALASGKDIYWCLCPKANLYIEDNLPDISLFQNSDTKITIGTDSLASNDKLCIFSEILTLKKCFPDLSFIGMLRWATLNGAEFLGVQDRFGSIEKGKTPGLNLIRNVQEMDISDESVLQRLV